VHELAAEKVFTVTPPGLSQPPSAVLSAARKHPAEFFGRGGWDGPSVTVSFTSSAAPVSTLRFYGEQAAESGWHATAVGAYRVTDRWTKTYPDGTPAYLLVSVIPRGGLWSCQVVASAPAAT
jgi:hypothetical protein